MPQPPSFPQSNNQPLFPGMWGGNFNLNQPQQGLNQLNNTLNSGGVTSKSNVPQGLLKKTIPSMFGELNEEDFSDIANYLRNPFADLNHPGIQAYMNQGQGFNHQTGSWMDNRPVGQKGYPTSRPTVSYNKNGIPSLGYEQIPSGEKSVGQQQTETMNARGMPSAAQWSAHINTVADQLRAGTFNGGQGPQAALYRPPAQPTPPQPMNDPERLYRS